MPIPKNAEKYDIISSQYVVGKVAIPDQVVIGNIQSTGFSFDTSLHTDPTVTLSVTLEMSVDNGVTWRTVGGFVRPGGPVPNGRDGLPRGTTTIELGFSPKSSPRLRGNVTISGKSLTTSGSFWWSTNGLG